LKIVLSETCECAVMQGTLEIFTAPTLTIAKIASRREHLLEQDHTSYSGKVTFS
jgi:hypothetical protein